MRLDILRDSLLKTVLFIRYSQIVAPIESFREKKLG